MAFHQHFFAAAHARADAHNVAMIVDMHVFQAQLLIHLRVTGGLLLLVEGGRFDFAQLNLVFQRLFCVLLGKGHSLFHAVQSQQPIQRLANLRGKFILHGKSLL